MSFIETLGNQQAAEEVKAMYRQLQGQRDYLPNYAKVYCYRPRLMQAWAELQSCIQETIEHRRFELVTLAAALALKNSYCSLAHGDLLRRKYYSDAELQAIVSGDDSNPLNDADQAMMVFATKLVADSSAIEQSDIDELRRLGFSDAEIFDIAASASARCFFAKLSDALGVMPDAAFDSMPESLRELLLVGRAIESRGTGH
ncbi:peroxidase [Pseudomaricurvus alkylphenolicus]|jgi:uncharacterized peroxidase-related enzyme|uniref:carboxymuconolactone decarboxylase family protein n=1 Tax=Pseudomaricurvus alkylphenolicus TaxID=1306991 RepID=UPI001423B934|nr:carboxymuconolactone decarboxylase family protein [Pseudomaricurvus alkylphenolicus]NIB42385.1 peroxidase [Pseudomaricurvus alkylphenolicus]